MKIYESDGESIGAEGEIALAVNSIEKLVLTNPDEEKFSSLIARLKDLSEHFPKNVKMHINEIYDVVEDVMEYYKEIGVNTPDISFLNNYGK